MFYKLHIWIELRIQEMLLRKWTGEKIKLHFNNFVFVSGFSSDIKVIRALRMLERVRAKQIERLGLLYTLKTDKVSLELKDMFAKEEFKYLDDLLKVQPSSFPIDISVKWDMDYDGNNAVSIGSVRFSLPYKYKYGWINWSLVTARIYMKPELSTYYAYYIYNRLKYQLDLTLHQFNIVHFKDKNLEKFNRKVVDKNFRGILAIYIDSTPSYWKGNKFVELKDTIWLNIEFISVEKTIYSTPLKSRAGDYVYTLELKGYTLKEAKRLARQLMKAYSVINYLRSKIVKDGKGIEVIDKRFDY